ncbi:MAG: cohesin domain-containing protein [Betaproteobacteria bacterium]|nr:cohesin domain-containing protein [Betaproteobacteria bacterium]
MERRTRFAWLALAGGAVAVAAYFAPAPAPSPEPAPDSAVVSSAAERAADTPPAALPEREAIGKPRGEVFAQRSWVPPAPRRAAPKAAVAEPPPPPPPPAMPYRVAGKVVYEGGANIVLAKGDRVLWVSEGETLPDGYRVDAITPDRVTLTYLPLGIAQHIAVASGLASEAPVRTTAMAAAAPASGAAEAGPAKLRFEGPGQVSAGKPFNVALKVTSGEAVRASPLQLSFDAKLLEPVNVRAGGFFAGGNFSYRVGPAGSIFVGASGKGAVPADAEFVVVTFRPIQPGGTAELKLSSLLLQGAAGRAIVHDQPAAFRTAIVQ